MTITAEHFWQMVEQVGWGTKTSDSTRIRMSLRTIYSKDEMDGFEDHLINFYGKLRTRLEKWEQDTGRRIPTGDDGFNDLVHHIVGLGREVYEQNLANPELAYDRANKYDYEESFHYCFLKWSGGNLKSLKKRLASCRIYVGKYTQAEYVPIRDKILALLDEAEQDWKKAKAIRTQVERLLEQGVEVMRDTIDLEKYRSEFHSGESGNPLHNKWALLNVLSDMDEHTFGNSLGLTRVLPSEEASSGALASAR